MDNQRLERIIQTPGRATMDDVRWLCKMLVQLQVDYADEKVRCFKVEQDLDECREKLMQKA